MLNTDELAVASVQVIYRAIVAHSGGYFHREYNAAHAFNSKIKI